MTLRNRIPRQPVEYDINIQHKGTELDSLPDHRARAAFCYDQMRKYRNKYWDMQARFVQKAYADPRLAGEPKSVQKSIGEQRWSNEEQAKTMIGLEQMWCRWASLEAQMAQLDRVL